MLVVPLQPTPNQSLDITLGNQLCTINVYTTAFGLFCDLLVNNTLVIGGVICQNLNRIVRSVCLGFIGDLMFNDTQGSSDPVYTGLGTRYVLLYIEASDLPPGFG